MAAEAGSPGSAATSRGRAQHASRPRSSDRRPARRTDTARRPSAPARRGGDDPLGQRQVEVDPLGQEILDQHALRWPAPGRRGRNRRPAARSRAAPLPAMGRLNTCRPRHRQRPARGNIPPRRAAPGPRSPAARSGHRRAVAGQSGRVDRLAGAVGAAVGGQEHIDRPGRRAGPRRRGPTGRIQGRSATGTTDRRPSSAVSIAGAAPLGAAGQPGVEADIAARIGGRARQHRVRPARSG